MRQGLRQGILIGVIAALLVIVTPLSSFGYTINYTYDDAYRLTQVASDTGFVETYTYDEVGNRLSLNVTVTPDTSPDPFVFASISNVALNTLTVSNAVNITGINTPASLSITGGEYSISTDNGATWSAYSSSTPSTISPNSLIKVRQMSASTSVTTTVATLIVGGVSGTFSVTTADATPPVSAILTPEDGSGIMNTSFTINGTSSDIGTSVSKVEISINGGTWTQATGTINWTYQWTGIATGTYTIQSRATDSVGNVETPKPGITVHVYAATPNNVSISGRGLTINSQPFTIRGINYSPVPIGEDPYNPPYGDYITSAYSAIHTRDLAQIRQLGSNTIRLWVWDTEADHKDFLDQAYAGGTNPIYVIAGYNINAGYDLTDQTTRDIIKEDWRAMIQTHKDHPAILGWAIGNDLNTANHYGTSLTDLFSLIEEMAAEAHILDPDHPVVMPLADEDLIQTITAYDASVPSLDIWGTNIYRGNSFGDLFSTYQATSTKPLLITGYGIDAYNDTAMTEDQTAQADHAAALWNEIVANSATSIGGLLTEYGDQWWRGMLSADAGCPEPNNAAVHGDCGEPSTSMPDGYDNYEWWGVMRPADNGTGLDTMERRSVFARLQNIWCSPINQPGLMVTTPNGGDSYQAGTTQTIQWTYTGDPGDSIKIELYKGGVLNLTIAASVSTGTLCSGTYAWTIPLSQTIGTDYRIRITSTSNSAFTDESDANFTILSPPCTVNAPTVSIVPSSQTITSNAGSVSYTVSITNNDSGVGCASTSFNLPVSNTNSTDFAVPTGLTPVTLAAGESTTVTLPISAVPGKPSGTTSTSVTATATGHADGVSNSVTTTLLVASGSFAAGPNNSATGANNTSTGTVAWTTPGNVSASDNANATASNLANNTITNYLMATGFNFAVPANATISGITVTIERRDGGKSSTVSIRDNSVRLVKGGVITGTDKADTATYWPAADGTKTYGASTDLWGSAWSPADINSSSFGVAISAKSVRTSGSKTDDALIDNIKVTVSYTAPLICLPAAPTVSITPSSQTITTNGGTATYNVSITNNDSGAGCSSTTFSLPVTNSNSTDFTVAANLTPVTLAAGANTTISLPVAAVSGKTSGTTATSVSATAAGHSSGASNSVTTTLAVAPAPVAVLNAWSNLYSGAPNNTSASNFGVGSFTVGSGTNRLLLVAVVMETGSNANPTISATYGGAALTQIRVTGSNQKENVWMGYLKDAQIGSGSQALTVTYSNATGNATGLHVTWSSYSGVNQTNPVASSGATNTATTSATFGSTISYINNGMTTVVAGNGGTPATGTLTATPSFTAGTATTTSEHTSRTFTTAKHTASGSYTASTAVTWSGKKSSAWSGLVVVSLQP